MTSQTGEFAGRIAVITGGGRGFGQAFGRALAEREAHAVLLDIDGTAAEQAADAIRGAGGQATGYECDVASEEQVGLVMADIAATLGGIDILINNAGLHSAEYGQSMSALGVPKLRRLFDVNVMGVIICTMAA